MPDRIPKGWGMFEEEIKYEVGEFLCSEVFESKKDDILHSLKYLYQDVSDLKTYYIKLGFHLHEFESYRYHTVLGFRDIFEFAEANLHMDKSSVSRCISVWKRFSLCNSGSYVRTMFPDERYKDYSYSQLCEMVSMKDDDLRKVKPDMSVRQIRELKKGITDSSEPMKLDKALAIIDEVVATSQQEKKPFVYSKYAALHGSAQTAYVKSRDVLEKKGAIALHFFDHNGKPVFPEISNFWFDVIGCEDGCIYYIRLNEVQSEICL